jgi:mono/diheme cytochrome c family protein
MFGRKRVLAAAVAVACGAATSALAVDPPKMGVAAPADLIALMDKSIPPDGAGLPPGQGTPKQGEAVFAQRCAACHGVRGEGATNDRLVGGQGTLTEEVTQKTVGSFWPYATTLFDYVRRAMPYDAPTSLKDEEVYGVVAYVLFLNGIIKDTDTLNAQTLAQVKMPNRDGFVNEWKEPTRAPATPAAAPARAPAAAPAAPARAPAATPAR